MFEKYENLFIVEDGDRGPVIERTFAKTEDELVGMNQDPYPVKVWNASGQIAHLPTRDGGSLDVIPNSTILDFTNLTPAQLDELMWGVIIVDSNSKWNEIKDNLLSNDLEVMFLKPDGSEISSGIKESTNLELYNDKYGSDIDEILNTLKINHDLTKENLVNVIKSHTIQTITKDNKTYLIAGVGDTYAIAEIKMEGSAKEVAQYALDNDLGSELIDEII